MSLFQKSVEQKYLKQLDGQLLAIKYAEFKNHFHNPQIQENIRNSKEGRDYFIQESAKAQEFKARIKCNGSGN